ncbi:hypothetical protein Enr13x_76730 [Stieleria neptunia]|uniref:Uncharacterized protein n=1 Tax=Stieleria neptunia TaxID=2527979 RepID=A0A518I3S5_9BACT|nr:hypothetical protein [Stieleria neptunia]QDV47761.1 hypothetical protein Enr13x_76730 [Stieleria neptunia]
MSIPVKGTATTTCDLLVSSDYLGGQTRQQTVVGVGKFLTKSIVRIVPRGPQLIGVRANSATFISSVVATPTQNLCNFNTRIRRFQVGRAALGSDHIEIAALSRGAVRSRIQVATTLLTLATTEKSTEVLQRSDAFECLVNADADVNLTLPRANRAMVGMEYYFAVNPTVAGGTLRISCGGRDAIQIRESQTLSPAQVIARRPTNGIVRDAVAKRVEFIEATQTNDDKNRTSVVMACRGPGLWVAENPTAKQQDDDVAGLGIDPPLRSLWSLGTIIED